MARSPSPFDLELPKSGLKLVQQTRSSAQRKSNVLYLPCRRLDPEEIRSDAFRALVQAMRNLMNDVGGIGLAANQIGKSLQLFVIEAKLDNPRYSDLGDVPFQVFVNPRVTDASPELRNFWHGCLSGEGEDRGNVATYEWIEYEALDDNANPRKGRLEGLGAVIFQHELRHLLGGTYLDRAQQYLDSDTLEAAMDRGEQHLFERVGADLPHLISDYQVGSTLEEYYKNRVIS